MTSLLINILITLVGLTIIIVGAFSFFPNLEKALEEKLKNSLSRKSKDHGPLAQILYKYNHKDSHAWSDWILTQDPTVQQEALEKLIAHIEQSPSSWGAITPEVITALSKFSDQAHIKILRGVLSAARKMWKKYMVCESCYTEALRGIIHINPTEALGIIPYELGKIIETEAKEEQGVSIVTALTEFSQDTDLNDIFKQIIIDGKQAPRVREYAMTVVADTYAEQAPGIFSESVKGFTLFDNILTLDDQKIFETLLHAATKEINDESFELIFESLTNPKLSQTTIKVLDLILKSHVKDFSSEQLYKLSHCEEDQYGSVANMMAAAYDLKPPEKALTIYQDVVEEFPFKKAPINNEHANKALPIPDGMEEIYEKLKDIIKERSIGKQTGISGGIVLTGYSNEEKLYLCRAYAAERKQHFIYASFDDVLGSSTTAKSLLDLIATHKPCIVYFDDIDSIFKNLDPSFVKSFKHYFIDSTITIIGTLNVEAEIDENNSCALFDRAELKDLFPNALEISNLSDAYKNKVLAVKLGQLEASRGQQNYESLNILEPTDKMSFFEFNIYLTKYFKASLIVFGALLPVQEFKNLDGMVFEGKAKI